MYLRSGLPHHQSITFSTRHPHLSLIVHLNFHLHLAPAISIWHHILALLHLHLHLPSLLPSHTHTHIHTHTHTHTLPPHPLPAPTPTVRARRLFPPIPHPQPIQLPLPLPPLLLIQAPDSLSILQKPCLMALVILHALAADMCRDGALGVGGVQLNLAYGAGDGCAFGADCGYWGVRGGGRSRGGCLEGWG